MRKGEQSLRDLWDNATEIKICIMGMWEVEEREGGGQRTDMKK